MLHPDGIRRDYRMAFAGRKVTIVTEVGTLCERQKKDGRIITEALH